MKKYRYLLFDLDGTLTASDEGILNCVKHGLEINGFDVPSDEKLMGFIGPPLIESYQAICGLSEEDTRKAIAGYRERYNVKGLFENRLYDGIAELLRDLKAAGYRLALATSKPEVFSLRIIEHFGVAQYLDAAAGSSVDREDQTKADMIRLAMERLDLSDEDKPYVLMIGDRKHDILGARECGIDVMGVKYGYAPEGEHEKYGADIIADTVEDIRRILLS